MAQADVLPFDAVAAQEGGTALRTAVAVFPVALDAFQIGVGSKLLDADNARRNATLFAEGVVVTATQPYAEPCDVVVFALFRLFAHHELQGAYYPKASKEVG